MAEKKTIDMEQAYKLILFAAVNKDLHELTDAVYKLTGHPTLISNNDGIKLSQSPEHEIGDGDWDYLLREGRSSSRHFYKFYKKYSDPGKNKKFPLLIADGDESSRPQLISTLKYGDDILAFSAVLLDEEKASDDEIWLTTIFNKAAVSILTALEKSDAPSRQIISDIILKENASPESIRALSVQYRPPYMIVAASWTESSPDDIVSRSLVKELQLMDSSTLTIIEENTIILLCYDMDERKNNECLEKIFDKILQYPMHIGVSDKYTGLSDSHGYYEQARLSIKAGFAQEPQKKIYRYNEYSPMQIVSGFAEHYCRKPFIDPIVLDIKSHDKKNGSDYLKTLDVYLSHMMNVKSAAEELCIHPNSMHYRISRIEELFGIDFNDPRQIQTLILSIMLDSVQK